MNSRRPLPTQKQAERRSIVADKENIESGTDKKLNADTLLRHRCARIGDATTVMRKTLKTMLEDSKTVLSRKVKRDIDQLKKTVLPMVEKAVKEEIPKSLKKLAPIPAAEYIHQTNEVDEARLARQTKKHNQSTPEKRIDDTFRLQRQKGFPSPPKRRRCSLVDFAGPPPPRISHLRRTKQNNTNAIEERLPRMPPPEDGLSYSAVEAVTYLKVISPKVRPRMIQRWIDQKWLRAGKSAVYRRLKADKDGKPIKPFGERGRERMMSKNQINSIAEYLDARHGKGFTLDNLRDAMKQEQADQIRREGNVPLQSTEPSKGSVYNYRVKLAKHPRVSISQTAIPKTNSRITAENSLISAMGLVVAVAANHWNPSLEPQWAVECNLREKATEGANKLFDMLKDFYGTEVHLRPIHPAFILSTDDTVQYVFEGSATSKDNFVLVGASSNKGRQTKSAYVHDGSKSMSGLRVKLTYTFTGTGLVAPVFVTVSGLTETELPPETCPSGILHLDIAGLTVGGGGVQVGELGKGSLVFIRNDSDKDKDNPTAEEYKLCEDSFPELLQYFLDHGHIPDVVYEGLGFQPDVDPDGIERRREAGIENESRQRVKCLTHQHQVQLRHAKLAAITAEKQRKVADRQKKAEAALATNKKCEEVITKDGHSLLDGTLDELIEHFRDLKNDLCRNFLFVRNPKLQLSKLPKKGKVDDVKDGPENLIRMVHDYRKLPVVLSVQSTTQSEISPDQPAALELEPATVVPVAMGAAKYNCFEKASDILESDEWLKAVKNTLVSDEQELLHVGEDLKANADVLQCLLLQRLASYVRRRVPDLITKKRGAAWVFDLTADNMARLAALMVIQGHVKSDLSCMAEDKTLLVSGRNFQSAQSEAGKIREGTYLYFDSNDGVHIRSGKVSGRSFSKRHEEHEKCARSGNGKLFYSRYPSKVLTSTNESRKGYFENLVQLMAMSYDSSSPVVDQGLSSIFDFDDVVKDRMSRLRFSAKEDHHLTYGEKQRHMVSYLCELAYDLAISVTDNVSTSPGFESCGLWSS